MNKANYSEKLQKKRDTKSLEKIQYYNNHLHLNKEQKSYYKEKLNNYFKNISVLINVNDFITLILEIKIFYLVIWEYKLIVFLMVILDFEKIV